MNDKKLSSEPYKGVRDFYPDDMAVQEYIFSVWSQTAESFGYAKYDASVLEPAELYKSKTSEEIVNDQTYTFIDRGDREVTLRPEMTPTVARMIAGKRRELSFPVRWYSTPNLFRYERPQRGRLREHWQLNCDLFGSNDTSADIEIIALAHQLLINFGADSSMFEIRINDRAWLNDHFKSQGLDEEQSKAMLALLDRKDKIDTFEAEAIAIAGKDFVLPDTPPEDVSLHRVLEGLKELGITNVMFSPSTVRGFLYYTGTIFEIFDVSGENARSIAGGGRYDNLASLFSDEQIPAVGFAMGDVTTRDFLDTHSLLTANIPAPSIAVLPTNPSLNIEAQKLAQTIRSEGISVAVDISEKKIGKKISSASDALIEYVIVLGEDEVASHTYTLKNLTDGTEVTDSLSALLATLHS